MIKLIFFLISHKYLNHGKCPWDLFIDTLMFIIFTKYLLWLSIIQYLHKVLLNCVYCILCLTDIINNDNYKEKRFKYVTNKKVYYSTPHNHILVDSNLDHTTSALVHNAPTFISGVRNYSSSVLLDNDTQIVQGDMVKDNSLNEFYEWFCGLTDGEGSFYIIKKNSKNIFEFNFQICLHIDDTKMLEFIQKTLGFGKVRSSGNTVRFTVNTFKDIEKILDIFTKYPLNSTKFLNFLDFKKAFELYKSSRFKNEKVIQDINDIKKGINTKRVDFKLPLEFKPKITKYWLLGFVEGEGSFFVKKDQYRLTFTLSQSSIDLALMESIRDFLYNLPEFDSKNMEKSSLRISTAKDTAKNKPITQLVITKTDIIKSVIIPFFSSITWRSKKELDFQDWVAIFKLKERGHHHQEEGVKVINLILNQMNNNRLSTSHNAINVSSLGREQLYVDINKLLNGPSNIEIIDGRSFILSLNRFYKGNVKTKVQIVDKNNSVLKTFDSISDCANFLGVSQPTAKNRLVKKQLFAIGENKSYYIKIINKDGDADSGFSTPYASKDQSNYINTAPSSSFFKMHSKSLSKSSTGNFVNSDFSKVSPQGIRPSTSPVYIFEKCSSEGFQQIGWFVSARRAGKLLGLSGSTIIKYRQSGEIFKERYKFSARSQG